METPGSGLVEIAREFLVAYRRTCEVAALHRSGDLSFEDVRGWVGDDESNALYRLKELCHRLFRDGEMPEGAMPREALFDLTVGALFHEAMRFRENLYQREVYGRRVGKLRGGSEDEAELIREFKKIVSGASVRLDEALQETETLLDQTRRQFRGLLVASPGDGRVARYLVENAGYVVLVFEGGVDRLFADVYGDAESGYSLAARSYLDSGHFAAGTRLLAEARRRGGDREAWVRLGDYATAMEAYLHGQYDKAVASLAAWLERQPPAEESAYAVLALDAVSHLGRLAEGEEGQRLAREAERLVERLQSVAAAR
jgi:tetratricopeptide (TPR) repeat protein